MKKLFRRKSSTSAPFHVQGGTTTIYSPEHSRPSLTHRASSSSRTGTITSDNSHVSADYNAIEDEAMLHTSTSPNGHFNPHSASLPQDSALLEESLSPNSDVLSVALSESETLFPVERSRLDLQLTYYENFSQYVPFLLRRVRLERERAEAEVRGMRASQNRRRTAQSQTVMDSVDRIDDNYSVATDTERESVSSDDVKTLIGNPNALTADQRQQMPQNCPAIMGLQPTNYDYKRSLILVSELLKTDYLVFPDRPSYELFKELKANAKKFKKSSVILYDANSKILKVNKDHFFKHSDLSASSVASSERKNSLKKPDARPSKPTKNKADKLKPERRLSGKQASAEKQSSHETSKIVKQAVSCESLLDDGPVDTMNGLKIIPDSDNTLKEVHKEALNQVSKSRSYNERSFPLFVVDSRNHIVPIEKKVLGKGLPLFKVSFPYMSSFRKNVPYMVLKRFKEVPDRPTVHDEGDAFETYDFCTVQMKGFNHYKRYIFSFRPAGIQPFKVLAYQCNFRPFTDFKFKGTRFRIFGSSMATAYISNYNPDMKLFIIDENKPSLVDGLINKQQNNDLLSIAKKKSSNPSASNQQNNYKTLAEDTEPELFDNPVPNRDNPILKERAPSLTRSYENSYIPNNMPPFSRYTDSCVYTKDSSIVPKKHTEVGKFDIYQSLDDSLDHFGGDVRQADLSSTFSVPTDTLVLTSIFLALRETNLRTTKRYPTTNSVARMGVLATMPTNIGGN